jgi:branched-chain amino acid transport system permease protein
MTAAKLASGRTWRSVAWLALIGIGLALPFLVSNYRVFQLNMVLVYAIVLLGLNMLTGYNGQISLGHGAFYAIGAYVAAILMDKFAWPYWATIPAAAAICFVSGFLFGLPALRLRGHYLALATFALAVAMPQILKYKKIEDWTGGVQGIVLIKPDAPFGLRVTADQWLYLFTLAIAAVLFLLAWNILRGRTGRAMTAIRDNPIAAEAMGVNAAFYKSATFGVSALYTGIGGAIGGLVSAFVAPDSFGPFLSIFFLVGIVVGGVASIAGALFGAIFIQFTPNVADAVPGIVQGWLQPLMADPSSMLAKLANAAVYLSKIGPQAIYGLILLAFVYLMPAGVAGFVRLISAKVRSGGRA